LPDDSASRAASEMSRQGSTSLREAWHALWRRRRFIATIEAALLALCILYCLIAPNKYEASASVEMRRRPSPRPPFLLHLWRLRPWPAFCAAISSPGA
jgi:uncharacterized protein involved in exopolysaccharide biosynthesis